MGAVRRRAVRVVLAMETERTRRATIAAAVDVSLEAVLYAVGAARVCLVDRHADRLAPALDTGEVGTAPRETGADGQQYPAGERTRKPRARSSRTKSRHHSFIPTTPANVSRRNDQNRPMRTCRTTPPMP